MTDTPERDPRAIAEETGMRLVPDSGQPWVERIRGPHPIHIHECPSEQPRIVKRVRHHQPSTVEPAADSAPDDDLRDDVALAIHAALCMHCNPSTGTGLMIRSSDAEKAADAALSVMAPEVERIKQVSDYYRQWYGEQCTAVDQLATERNEARAEVERLRMELDSTRGSANRAYRERNRLLEEKRQLVAPYVDEEHQGGSWVDVWQELARRNLALTLDRDRLSTLLRGMARKASRFRRQGREIERDLGEALTTYLDARVGELLSSIGDLRAERERAVIFPEDWQNRIGWLFGVAEADTWQKVCKLIESWRPSTVDIGDYVEWNPEGDTWKSGTVYGWTVSTVGNATGALKTAARRVGVSVAEYQSRVARGQKWCTGCKRSPRDPLHEAARKAVAYEIRRGRMRRANDELCTDCGHMGPDKRHEYDHHKGYAVAHHLDVEPVCTTCHADRERARRAAA